MKIILLCLFPIFTQAQKIVEDKKDEFTGKQIKRTSWERFTSSSKQKLWAYMRGSRIDSVKMIDIKFQLGGKVFGITEGAEVMLKLENNAIVTLQSLRSEISTTGAGAIDLIGSNNPGVLITCVLKPADIEAISKSLPQKIRMYLIDGYVEADIKKSFGEAIAKAIALIQ